MAGMADSIGLVRGPVQHATPTLRRDPVLAGFAFEVGAARVRCPRRWSIGNFSATSNAQVAGAMTRGGWESPVLRDASPSKGLAVNGICSYIATLDCVKSIIIPRGKTICPVEVESVSMHHLSVSPCSMEADRNGAWDAVSRASVLPGVAGTFNETIPTDVLRQRPASSTRLQRGKFRKLFRISSARIRTSDLRARAEHL